MALLVASQYALPGSLATVIGESGFEAQAGWIIVSGYSVICFEIKFSGSHRGLSTPDPSLSATHFSIKRGRATTSHYTHHQVSLMMSRNTILVPSLGLCIGPACEAGLSAGMRR